MKRQMWARRAIPVVAVAILLAAAAVASAYPSSYRDGPLTATFSASTHHPNCKQRWPVTVTARYNGKPAHALAWYQFLYNGKLVNTQYPFGGQRQNPHYHKYAFYGSFKDTGFGPFGALAVGHTLIVRAVVQAGRYTAYPGYSVQVVSTHGCPSE